MQLFEKGDAQSINTAVEKMKSISGWKDSDEKFKEFSERYEVVFAKEHAEKEEKERIEKLKSEYDKKYSELLKSKYKNQNKLEKVQKELTAMNNKMKSEASAKFGICAIGVFFLGAGVIILFFGVDEGSSGTGILFLVGGGFFLRLALGYNENNIKKAINELEQEKSKVEKVLKDIEAIPSLEKFIEDHSE